MSIVKITNVRLSFADLFQPDAKYGRYGASFPIVPGSANAAALDAAVTEVAAAKWGAKAEAVLAKLKGDGVVAYAHSPKVNADGEVYDGYSNMYTLNASNKARPTVLDLDRSPLTEGDGRPYSGCYVVAVIEIWAQDNSWGRRINATLKGVQFFAHGEAFSGVDEFDDLSVDAAMA